MSTRIKSQKKKALSSVADILTTSHIRLMVLLILFCCGITAVIAKLIWLIFITGWGVEERRHPPVAPLQARADIVDRNGRTLARTIDVWSIGIHPRTLQANHISDPDILAANLAALLPERTADEYRKILHSNRSFVFLRRHASPELVRALNMLVNRRLISCMSLRDYTQKVTYAPMLSAGSVKTAMVNPAWNTVLTRN